MHNVKVNLLHPEPVPAPPHAPRPPKKRRPFVRGVIVFATLFVASFSFGRASLTHPSLFALGSITDLTIISQFRHLVGAPDKLLKGEEEDRISILLLGMGGETHEGPNLTDTVMVANIRLSTNEVALLSIPRDLLIPIEGHGWRKINSVNAFGEAEDPGKGADYTRKVVEDVLGTPIPYVIRVDFNGFKSMIDAVDGVDIYVDRTFSDPTYPTEDYLTKTVTFKKGWTHMDGATALIYSRSRHGNNGEGTDFARAKRQQKVLLALKDKLMAAETYKNPATIANTLAALRANISTNMQIGELVRIARMAQRMENVTVKTKVIDNSPDSPLTDSTYGGAYVLVPKNDSWTPLREIAKNIFDVAATSADAPAEPKPAPIATTKSKIEIQNGTPRAGYARTIATAVSSSSSFEIVKIGNAEANDHDQTIIEDYTGSNDTEAISKLQNAIAKATNLISPPKIVKKTGNASSRTTNADYVVILGSDGS